MPLRGSEPITVRTPSDLVTEIDAIAAATDRSRNDIVNQALRQYLDVNASQIERIKAGVNAVREGQVRPAAEVFAGIADKYNWSG